LTKTMTPAERRYEMVVCAKLAYGKHDAIAEMDRILREELTRALTAQAWAVAIAYAWSPYYGETTDYRWVHGTKSQFDGLCSMPAPAEIAAELLR
jgi:hypothetical protein